MSVRKLAEQNDVVRSRGNVIGLTSLLYVSYVRCMQSVLFALVRIDIWIICICIKFVLYPSLRCNTRIEPVCHNVMRYLEIVTSLFSWEPQVGVRMLPTSCAIRCHQPTTCGYDRHHVPCQPVVDMTTRLVSPERYPRYPQISVRYDGLSANRCVHPRHRIMHSCHSLFLTFSFSFVCFISPFIRAHTNSTK